MVGFVSMVMIYTNRLLDSVTEFVFMAVGFSGCNTISLELYGNNGRVNLSP